MIKLKKLIIKEEVDRNKLKNALSDAIDATDKLSKAVNEIKNVGIPYKVYMNNYRKISLPLILESSPRKRNGSL